MPTNANLNAPGIPHRFAPSVARAIVRIWPTESREWGQAFAAELPAAATNHAAISWLIGGLMLLLREWLKHAWRALGRPIGAGPGEKGGAFKQRCSRTPRTPLWVMLVLTLSSAAILLHPEVRQVLGSLRSVYTSTAFEPDNWSSVKKLRDISNTNRDPHILALLSLLSDNDEERLRLSEEAIEKDPSLTWLDYEQSLLLSNDSSKLQYLPEPRLVRLQNWDPQNSIPHFLAAEMIAQPAREQAFDGVMRGKRSPSVEQRLAANPQWLSEMHAAFTAPKYDNYTSQAIDLVRNVSARFSVHDPDIAGHILSRKRLVQFSLVQAYVQFLLDRGTALEKSGHAQQAIASYSEALQFAQRASLSAATPIEQFFAQKIGSDASEKLEPLYSSTGRTDEASLVAFQLAQWNAERDPKMFRYLPLRYRQSQWKSLEWSGMLINLSGLSILVVFPLALISFLFVFERRKISVGHRGFTDLLASLFADAAPWLLLASSLLLYFTYHPYAKICAAFLNGGSASPDMQSFLLAMAAPHAIPDNFEFLRDPVYGWYSLTVGLCVLLVFFLWRMILRPKPAV
jgi:tetratricopeptide (TPR) repeat protein